jgi:cystine transport system substrate-binding protein
MRKVRKEIFGLLLIVLIGVLAACGGGEENGTDENADGASDDSAKVSLYDEIMEKAVLTVGTEGTYAPFTFHNESGELTGYDVEVIKEVADRMGVEVQFEETQWDSMFAGLNAERFDLIANQVAINEDRLANYDFSVPYTYSSGVVVVAEDNDEITSIEDMEGKQAAQSLTSNWNDIAEENGAEVIGVEGLAQSIELIEQGRVDVTVNEKLAVLDYINQQGDDNIKIVDESDDYSEMAFTFNQGNEELVEVVNEHLEEMMEDGTLTEISEEWFGEDVSTN